MLTSQIVFFQIFLNSFKQHFTGREQCYVHCSREEIHDEEEHTALSHVRKGTREDLMIDPRRWVVSHSSIIMACFGF